MQQNAQISSIFIVLLILFIIAILTGHQAEAQFFPGFFCNPCENIP